MALSERQWGQISARTGVPVRIMKTLLGSGERSAQSSVSPAGATGRAQLMPGTARNLERRYKINTRTEFGNVLGGAYYLAEQKRNFGSWRLAFAAYNAGPNAVIEHHGVPPYRETQDYVRRMMTALGAAPGGGEVSTGLGVPPPGPQQPAQLDPGALAQGRLQDIASGQGFQPTEQLGETAAAITQAAQNPSSITGVPATGDTGITPTGDWQKFVHLGPGADRAGVATNEPVLQFVGELGIRYGRRLTIATGTNHNQFVKGRPGHESDHWQGNAADISMSGARLTRLGRAALVLAGMPAAEARKARGGVYNVGRYQIIFNTNSGGNHWNHLHVGVNG